MKRLNFCIIGVAGYIAPRHLQSIKALGHNLLISYDPNDSVGILDKYFPKSLFFNKYNNFKKEFEKIKNKIDYIVVLSPNYLHFTYIKFGLMNNINVICEKPLIISSKYLKKIEKLEKKYKAQVFNILQLRTLDVVQQLKKKIKNDKRYKVNIKYITPRGHWYHSSWKGNQNKSGGILFNIGIHLLDLVCYLFGDYKKYQMSKLNNSSAKGQITFNHAKVDFHLSINKKDTIKYKKPVIRDFVINNKRIDLAKNFEQAHIDCYKQIISKKMFTLSSVNNSITLATKLKNELL
jgi:UDP-N-acetyl-2-amino-2-deoxyglucuronate dehydrogenase